MDGDRFQVLRGRNGRETLMARGFTTMEDAAACALRLTWLQEQEGGSGVDDVFFADVD